MKKQSEFNPAIMYADDTHPANQVKYFKDQKFDWGSITWIIEPDQMDAGRVSVGLVTFLPGCRQSGHTHMREEQVLYVLSGSGRHTVNNKEYGLRAGTYFHMPPHCQHDIINTGKEDLRLLLVYAPSKIYHLLEPLALEPQNSGEIDQPVFDVETLDPILHRLSQALELSLVLLDPNGKTILKTDNHPAFCSMMAEAAGGTYCQEIFRRLFTEVTDNQQPHFFFCCCNIASIIIPITYAGRVLAYLKCGEIFLSSADKERLLEGASMLSQAYALNAGTLYNSVTELPIEPKSRLYSAGEATSAIANTIIKITTVHHHLNQLNDSRLSLVKEQLAKSELERALRESGLKLLQSQVNPHFLFNTLNTISQMAYLEGASKASELTRNLSELLRYTLRKSEQLIPVREELALIRHYVNIQKERFGDRIDFRLEVEPGLEEVAIPCMLLQPLVENAIIHGLDHKIEGGRIDINISAESGMLCTRVNDNGVGFDVSRLESAGENRVGLNSTRSRLRLHYADKHSFKVESAGGKGTQVTVKLPLEPWHE